MKGTAVSVSPVERPKNTTGDLVQGLDDIFDISTGIDKEVPGSSQGTARMAECATGTAHWLSVEAAAKRLSISANAVIKRLGKGKLTGKKVAQAKP